MKETLPRLCYVGGELNLFHCSRRSPQIGYCAVLRASCPSPPYRALKMPRLRSRSLLEGNMAARHIQLVNKVRVLFEDMNEFQFSLHKKGGITFTEYM